MDELTAYIITARELKEKIADAPDDAVIVAQGWVSASFASVRFEVVDAVVYNTDTPAPFVKLKLR